MRESDATNASEGRSAHGDRNIAASVSVMLRQLFSVDRGQGADHNHRNGLFFRFGRPSFISTEENGRADHRGNPGRPDLSLNLLPESRGLVGPLSGSGVKHLLLVLMFLGTFASVSLARPPLPPPDVRAAPGKPGWSVDERTGCWVWNASPRLDQTVQWSEGCSPVGRATGRGILEWRTDGKVSRYEGDIRYGELNGRGTLTAPNGDRYEGEFRDGKRHGRGVLTWGDGERYEGEFRDDRMHGHGVYVEAIGNRFEGEFRDGQRDGQGVYTWTNGDRYVGGFRNGKRHGRGVYTWTNGERYVGGFRDGKMHGRGVMTRPDGDRYEGEWREGKRHGRGVWSAGAFRHEGEFRDGKPNGQGVTTMASGQRLVGEFRDGVMHGHGVFTSASGNRFEGKWRDGRADGYGVYKQKDGEVYKGEWVDGCFRKGETRIAVGRPASQCR